MPNISMGTVAGTKPEPSRGIGQWQKHEVVMNSKSSAVSLDSTLPHTYCVTLATAP